MADPVAPIGTSRAINDTRPVDRLAGWTQDGAEVSMIELVIARSLRTLLRAPLHAVRIYAEGLLTGAVTVVTDIDHWAHVPTAMGRAIHDEQEADGVHWTLDLELWQLGIRSLHGLAHGVIEHDGAAEPYGYQTALCLDWYVRCADLEGTDLTLDDVAAAFDGDVVAAARALSRACEVFPCP